MKNALVLVVLFYTGTAMAINKVSFDQQWTVNKSLEETFDLFNQAFANSAATKIWPKDISELRSKDNVLKQGSIVKAAYKTGPFTSKAEYTIKEINPPKKLVYRATPEHPLNGGATITFSALERNKTNIQWKGNYERKSLSGAIALIWFKFFFEERFFGALKKNMADEYKAKPSWN